MSPLNAYFTHLRHSPALQFSGQVLDASNGFVESAGPPCSVGECCEIVGGDGQRHAAEVIGFRGERIISMPLDGAAGVRFGDQVVAQGRPARIGVGAAMLGHVLDGAGRSLERGASYRIDEWKKLDAPPPSPLDRIPITIPMPTGVRAVDGLATLGRGQRMGIFGGSGVGKSTLIGMMTRNTAADMTVIGLVGERGREVTEFLDHSLGEEGRRRSVVVVSTSDMSPLMRMRAAESATATAEYFAAQGRHVLLILDSLTRYAMAAREIGLAAGEPPASKGYPPSAFARMARLLERAGNFQQGSITGLYTVLMEGDDEQDPVVDSARSILDGHILLSRELAVEGVYPPVDPLRSLSRLMPAVTGKLHRKRAAAVRRLLSVYERSEDLLRVGAYKPGLDAELDAAIRLRPRMRDLLRQETDECTAFDAEMDSFAFVDEATS